MPPPPDDSEIDAHLARTEEDAVRARLRSFLDRVLRDDSLLLQCAWCGRIRTDGEWFEESELAAAGALGLLVDRTTHGICPRCLELHSG